MDIDLLEKHFIDNYDTLVVSRKKLIPDYLQYMIRVDEAFKILYTKKNNEVYISYDYFSGDTDYSTQDSYIIDDKFSFADVKIGIIKDLCDSYGCDFKHQISNYVDMDNIITYINNLTINIELDRELNYSDKSKKIII